ncbi:hypothetical protein [Phenylobacterium sp.]|uniref:hypothetical protein n=1 Tax=Phenylobacterium sp. TaxID=1871053 RepID=UPI002C0A9114|nr:hypothetical protein [Phenylobacterium sp.]HVI34422.1 hypothetical protein [Phenylobacterium sp.]
MNNQNMAFGLSGAVMLAMSLVALWVWPKFVGLDIHPIYGWAEAKSGVGWLEPGARYAVGIVAGVLALLLLVKRTRLAAAVGALVLSTAFIVAHLTPWLGINIPDYTPLMEALAAGRTAAEIEALGLKGDRGAHFAVALVNAGLAVLVIAAELGSTVRRRRDYTPMELAGA